MGKMLVNKKKISDLKVSLDNLKKKRKERDTYWAIKLSYEDDPNRKKILRRNLRKEKVRIARDIEKVENNIIRYKLNYFKIKSLVKRTLGERSKSHSTAIRGYRSYTSGHDIDPPTIYNPYIRIYWNTGGFVSGEKERKINESFKNKLKPVLRANNIPFTEDSDSIYIGKKS